TLIFPPVPPVFRLIGTSLDGSNVLFLQDNVVLSADTNGALRTYGTLPPGAVNVEGWITPNFAAYVERAFSNGIELAYVKDGMVSFVNGNAALSATFYAVAAGDYDGAWMILRDASKSTTLWSHTASQGLVKRWEDITAPEVEALHPARSN